MENGAMTGNILLSNEASAQIRQNILNPSAEYIQSWQAYFDRLSSSMVIRSDGVNSKVEFDDLDLS